MSQPDGVPRFTVKVNGQYVQTAYTNALTFARFESQATVYSAENVLSILKFALSTPHQLRSLEIERE